MLFLLVFVSVFSSSYSQILPFEEVSKKADAIIARMDANEQVDPEELKEVSLHLILHLQNNLEKTPGKYQPSHLFCSREDLKNSVVVYEKAPFATFGELRYIDSEPFKVFKKAMEYLDKIPFEHWSEPFNDRISSEVFPYGLEYDFKTYPTGSIFTIVNMLRYIAADNVYKVKPVMDDIGEERGDIFKDWLNTIIEIRAIGVLQGRISNFEYALEKNLWTARGKYLSKLEAAEVKNLLAAKVIYAEDQSLLPFDSDELLLELNDREELYREGLKEFHKNFHKSYKAPEMINQYLPAYSRSNNLNVSIDNLARRIAEDLDGKLGDKENILLFGEYTQQGRTGGIFTYLEMKGMYDLVLLFGVLGYANGLCEEREVSMTILSEFKKIGIISTYGDIKTEKLDPGFMQENRKIVFSPAMTRMYNKGVKAITIKK